MDTRHRVSNMEWEPILAAQAKSGLSASGFCKEHGIRPSSFFSARKRQRLAQQDSDSAALSSELSVPQQQLRSSVAVRASKRSGFVSVQMSDPPSDLPCTSTEIRVHLRSGHQLWVSTGFDANHLVRLINVLEMVP